MGKAPIIPARTFMAAMAETHCCEVGLHFMRYKGHIVTTHAFSIYGLFDAFEAPGQKVLVKLRINFN